MMESKADDNDDVSPHVEEPTGGLANQDWSPKLPQELEKVQLVSLCLTTPPPITEHLCPHQRWPFLPCLMGHSPATL